MRPTQIGIGFDAWGGIARAHTLGLRALPILYPQLPFRVDLAAVATRRPAENGDWIREAGFRRVVPHAADLITDPDVTGVDICTPNALHVETAISAWQAGKSVYCEKPLAESLASGEAMAGAWRQAAASSQAAAVSQVAFVLRFWPAVARARDWIAEGRLGRILTFRARHIHGGYLTPTRLYSWRVDQALSGGGAMADLGVHMIDMVRCTLGEITVEGARTRTFVTERATEEGALLPVQVDDWAEAACRTASGAAGTIEASRVGDGQEETTLEIFGSEGSLRISASNPHHPLWFDRNGNALLLRAGEGEPGPVTRAVQSVWPPAKLSLGIHVDAHMASLHWWLRRLADREWAASAPAVAAGIEDGLAAQAVLEQIYRMAGQKAGS